MIYKSLTFWTLLCGLLAFVATFFFPNFPLDAAGILAIVLFLLGLIGVVPSVRAARAINASIINSLAFWQMVAGLLYFVVYFYAPTFPIDADSILLVILFVLGFFNVYPELRARGILK